MEGEDRKQLLEAGKASLLAFQKKGKKRKKKKKEETTVDSTTENITDELSLTMSENISSLEQTSPHSGNVSPIPFDHDVSQDPLPTSLDHQSTSGLSEVARTADGDDNSTQPAVPASNNLDKYLQLTEPVLENEKNEEPLPEFDTYKEEFYTSSPVNQFDESTSDAAKVQVPSEDKFEQVVDELGSNSLVDKLQEQEFVPEEIVTASLKDQQHKQQQEINRLKEKLEVSLSSLKEVEQELLDSQSRHEEQLKSLNVSHTAELEKVHEQHRMVVEKLTSEMSPQPPDITTQSQQLDRDEIEMERLKLIKENLRENYEKEKNELRESLLREYQEKVESYKKQMEERANTLLEQYREQDLAAYNKQIKQKDEAAATLLQTLDAKELEYQEKLSQLKQHIDKLEERISKANEEKQLEVAALYKSHSDELHSMKLGKQELESDLTQQIEQWKSKAANLEHQLNSTTESAVSVDTESIEQLKADYEEKLAEAIQEKSQLESQLLSKINALNEELTKEKQQRELSVEEKDCEIHQLTAEFERLNKNLLAKETATVNASSEIEGMKYQHKEALEKLQISLTQAHQKEMAATQKDLQMVSNQLQVLSNQVAELNESKHDAVSQLEKTQHQLNNLQLSFAQSKEEKQQLIGNIKKYQDQIHNLEVDLNAAQNSNAQTFAGFERDTSTYKAQISRLETAVSEFQSRELLLQTELQALREQKASEDDGLITVQDALFGEIDAEVLRKAENLTSSSFTSSLELVNKLLATLESKASEVMLLQESNKTLVSQVSELQENVSEDRPSTTEVDLLRAYEQLQVAFEELKDSTNIELENLKHEKQALQDVHKEVLREKEKTISSLQKQLQTANLVSVELQNEFGREFTKYESEKQSLEQAVKEKTAAKDEVDTIVSAQAKEIEERFEKERQALIAKLNEKETLEAELTTRKIDLEKRLTEKAKLEEVLAEKSRLEQELRAQKSELERELFEIETKLKTRENEIQQERSDWSTKLSQKDSTIQVTQERLQQQDELFLQKERQLKESHEQEVHKLLTDIENSNSKTKEIMDNLKITHAEEMATLQSEMDEKNNQALNEMETRLNKSHQEELGELKEKHSVEVEFMIVESKKKIEELTAELNANREREINDVTTALTIEHKEAIANFTNQLEAKRQKELSTLKEVLERQRNEALTELRDQMSNEKQKELDACRLQYQYQYDLKLEEQRKQLEESHSLHLEAHERGIFTDQKQLMETELLQQKQMYEVKMNQLELEHTETLRSKIEEAQSELLVKYQTELVTLQEKFNTDIAEALHQQEIALNKKYTEEIDKMKADFEAKLILSISNAEEKLLMQHQEDIAALQLAHQSKITSYEDTINDLKLQSKISLENLQQDYKNKEEVLKSQITELEKSATNISADSYHEELEMKLLGKEKVIEELSDASNKSRQHHEKEVNELNTKLSSLQEEYDRMCGQMKQDHVAELQALESKLTNQLSSRYEAKISVLQLEAGVKEQHVTDVYQQKINTLVQQHKEDALTKDMKFEERVSSLQADHEIKLNEVELQHISELENITSEFEQEIKKREVEIQDLKAQVAHVTSINKDYLSEMESLERQLQKIGTGKSQDLLHLEQEIELLAKQNDTAIKLAEAKIADKYEELLQSKTKELEDQYITKLATVQTERAIAFAQEMEQVKANMSAENNEKLSEAIAAAKNEQSLALQSEHKKILVELNNKWQLKQQELEERLKNEYMLRISELETKMAEERKQQLHMLKENYEEAMKTREANYMAEREKELKERAEYIDKLKLEFAEGKEAAVDEWNSQASSLHAKEVDSLNNELKKQNETISVLQAQLEDAHQNYNTQLVTMKEDFQQQIEQLKVDHQQKLEMVRNDKHTELVQQHMAKFKDMTDKLVQKHHSEMEQQSRRLNEGHVIEIEKLHTNYQQETGLLHNLLETKERQLKDVQAFVQQHISSQLLEEALVMTKSLKQLAQSSAKNFQPFSQTVLLLETKLGNVAHKLNSTSHSVATLKLTVQLEPEEETSFSAQSLFDSQLLQIEKQKNELQNELIKCQQKFQDTEAELVQKNKEISEVENALQKEKEISLSQAEEMAKLQRNLRNLITEHNVDVSKLQLTTQEHSDTTNTFALMHKEMEQLCIEKLTAERRLASLDSFIQECLQVVTALNTNVAQQLLNHLQDDAINDDQQPPHPQGHSPKAHDNTPTLLSTPLDKTVVMLQDSGLSSQQTTHVSETADTPKAEITETYGTPGAPSMTIYAAQDSLTDSTSSQNTYTPGELSIQNYEGMSGFQDNDSEEPIGTDHIPVQPVIVELQRLLESRGVSTLPSFSFSFPNASGCTSNARTFKDSLVSVQDIFMLLLQSFSSSSQEAVKCKKQLAECQTELLQANSELNQLLGEHESQCRQHENEVKKMEDEKHNCELRLQTTTAEIKSLQKQIQDSHEIITELESLIAQNKEQPAETGLKEEIQRLTLLLEQKETELVTSANQLEDLRQSQIEDVPDVDDKTDSLVSTAAASSLADDSDQEGMDNNVTDTLNIIGQLKAELTNRDEQTQQLTDELEEQAQTIASIKESNAQLVSQNAVVSESNVRLTANIQQLQEILNEKDENIRILNDGLAQLQSQYDAQQQTLSTKCSSLIDENKILSADLATRNEEIEELKNALQQSGDLMARLRSELGNVLESNKSLIDSLESDKAASNSRLVETISELKITQQQLVQAQEELQLKKDQLQKVENQFANQSEDFKTTKEELKQMKAKLKITEQRLPQAQEELQLKEVQLQKIENQLTSQSKDFKIAKEALEQIKVNEHEMQKKIDKLEAQLVEAKAKIIKCNGEKDKLEMQYKSSSALHAEELATVNDQHNQQMAKLKQSFEQQISEAHKQHNAVQSEMKLSHMQELARVTSEHNAALRELESNHGKQLSALKLEHAEVLLKQKEDLEALHAGQMSYMKLHAAESPQDADSLEEDDEDSEDDDMMTSEHSRANSVSLLLKIAEIAPQLRDEIKEVRDLCKLTGQPLPAMESGYYDEKNVLLEAIKSLSDLIMQTAEATKPDAVDDWRKSLLDAVQQVLQKERDVLMSAVHSPGNDLPPDYQELLQNQFANHAALLKELHTSDRDSLLAEIRQLRILVESLRNEQRQQLQNLFEQVKRLQQLAEAEKNALTLEIHSLQDTKGQQSTEIGKLREDLRAEHERGEKLLRSLEEEQQHNHELASASSALTKDNKELCERLQNATNLDVQLQQALTESEKHRTTLLEQVNALKCDLDRVNAELDSALSAQESLKQSLDNKNEMLSRLEHKQKAEREALIKSHQQITNANISENNERLHAAEAQIHALNASLQDSQAEKIKLETELEQANERIEQLDQSLAQRVEEGAQLQQELSAKTSALQEHDKHFMKLKKSLTQQSETIEKLQSKTAAKATQHQTVMTDMQALLKDKEEAISQLNSIIQAKEAELTKNTDTLLREKVKGTELQEELNAYKQQLEELRARELQNISHSKSLADQYTEATLELDNAKKRLANLEKEKMQLDLQVAALQKKLKAASLKKSKPEQNPELTALYKQLQSMLASELSKNSALRDALAAGDADSSDLIKMIEILLRREEIHAVTQESLQVDKDQLEKEVRQLNKQISQLQALLHTRQFGTVAKPVTSTLPDPQSTIQGDHEARNAEHVLKQSLEEERLQASLLKNQISMLEQKLATLHSDPRHSLSPIMVDVCMQTTDVSKSEMKAHDAELIEIFIKYREAAERCKSLMYQKDYLVKQLNTFYQTEQAAFIMIKEMGISVDDWSPRPTIWNSPRSITKFKVVVYVVLATIRLPLLCKRRQLRRSAVLSKRKKVIQYVVGRTQKKQSQHKEIPLKISTDLPDYKPPVATSHIKKPPSAAESHSQTTLQSMENSSEFLSLPTRDLDSVVSFTPIKLTSQVTKQPNVSTTKASKNFPDDPQVTAYLQGLEKLQARLKKM